MLRIVYSFSYTVYTFLIMCGIPYTRYTFSVYTMSIGGFPVNDYADLKKLVQFQSNIQSKVANSSTAQCAKRSVSCAIAADTFRVPSVQIRIISVRSDLFSSDFRLSPRQLFRGTTGLNCHLHLDLIPDISNN